MRTWHNYILLTWLFDYPNCCQFYLSTNAAPVKIKIPTSSSNLLYIPVRGGHRGTQTIIKLFDYGWASTRPKRVFGIENVLFHLSEMCQSPYSWCGEILIQVYSFTLYVIWPHKKCNSLSVCMHHPPLAGVPGVIKGFSIHLPCLSGCKILYNV